jgi:hypothetical protein
MKLLGGKKITVSKLVIFSFGLIFFGCSRNDRGYEEKPKYGEIKSKSDVPCQDESCLMIVSAGTIPRKNVAERPYNQGQLKEIRSVIKEKTIEFYEVEDDERFNKNPHNSHPVLSLPVTHLQYRCKENSVGECSNKEEEAGDDIPWQSKSQVKIDFEGIKEKQMNFLSIEFDNLFDSCHTELGKELKPGSVTVTNDEIYFELTKTFKTRLGCIQGNLTWDNVHDKVNSATFTVDYHYSIKKKSLLQTKGYETVLYPVIDHNKFGYFKDKKDPILVDGSKQGHDETYLLNRWHPEREIVYYLPENFFAPRNKLILEATKKVEQNINLGFKEANAKTRFKFERKPKDIKLGDISHSFVYMIEEPLASGLLGYGPSHTNPDTGEIFSARVVMYPGNMITGISRTWDQLVAENRSKLQKSITKESKIEMPNIAIKVKTDLFEAGKVNVTNLDGSISTKEYTPISPLSQKLMDQKSSKAKNDKAFEDFVSKVGKTKRNSSTIFTRKTSIEELTKNRIKVGDDLFFKKFENTYNSTAEKLGASSQDVKFTKEGVPTKLSYMNQESLYKANAHKLAKMNAFHSSMYDFKDTLITAIDSSSSELKTIDNTKYWIELSEKDRQKIINHIMPYSWATTLIHEVGHTLGLRHNFEASTDKENFWNSKELLARGLKSERAITHSSVMDYGAREMEQLAIFGKYDIAALRYAYAREVEIVNNDKKINKKFVVKKLGKCGIAGLTHSSTIQSQNNCLDQNFIKGKSTTSDRSEKDREIVLRPYAFCTDDNAGSSTTCDRFDRGSNPLETLAYRTHLHHFYYPYRNLKSSRGSFSAASDVEYAQYRIRDFSRIRDYFEEYNLFSGLYPELVGPKKVCEERYGKETCERFKYIRPSAAKAGKFLLDIVRTPAKTCHLLDYGKLKDVQLEIAKSVGVDVKDTKNLQSNILKAIENLVVELNEAGSKIAELQKKLEATKNEMEKKLIQVQLDILKAKQLQLPEVIKNASFAFKNLPSKSDVLENPKLVNLEEIVTKFGSVDASVHYALDKEVINSNSLSAITCAERFNDSFGNAEATVYVYLGETGKFLNNARTYDNPNAGSDQIDVRGIWIEKLVAFHYLTANKTGGFTQDLIEGNFLSIPPTEVDGKIVDLRQGIINTLLQFLEGKLELENQVFTKRDGTTYKHSFTQADPDLFKIKRPLAQFLVPALGLHNAKEIENVDDIKTEYDITQGVLNILGDNLKHISDDILDQELIQKGIGIYKSKDNLNSTVRSIPIGGNIASESPINVYALKQNVLANRLADELPKSDVLHIAELIEEKMTKEIGEKAFQEEVTKRLNAFQFLMSEFQAAVSDGTLMANFNAVKSLSTKLSSMPPLSAGEISEVISLKDKGCVESDLESKADCIVTEKNKEKIKLVYPMLSLLEAKVYLWNNTEKGVSLEDPVLLVDENDIENKSKYLFLSQANSFQEKGFIEPKGKFHTAPIAINDLSDLFNGKLREVRPRREIEKRISYLPVLGQ